MVDIYFDKSRTARIKARINENSQRVFRFFHNGAALDISSYGFQFILQYRINSTRRLFTLTEGDGLTVQGDDSNELLIEISEEQATVNADTYYWRLFSSSEGQTWLSGAFDFNNGESTQLVTDDTGTAVDVSQGFDYELDFEFVNVNV